MTTYVSAPSRFKETCNNFGMPAEMQDAFWNYFMYGWDPGGFGLAILRNDFCDAVCRAHPALSSETLRGIAKWFYNTRLPDAFGSDEKIKEWKMLTNQQRREAMEGLGLCPTVFDILRTIPGP